MEGHNCTKLMNPIDPTDHTMGLMAFMVVMHPSHHITITMHLSNRLTLNISLFMYKLF